MNYVINEWLIDDSGRVSNLIRVIDYIADQNCRYMNPIRRRSLVDKGGNQEGGLEAIVYDKISSLRRISNYWDILKQTVIIIIAIGEQHKVEYIFLPFVDLLNVLAGAQILYNKDLSWNFH